MPASIRLALMLLPAVVVLGGLFLGGLVLAIIRTVGIVPFAGRFDPTLEPWTRALQEPDLLLSILVTLWVAAASTLIATALGVGAALLLHRAGGGRLVTLLVQFNLTVPHVVTAVGMAWLLGQSGVLARLAHGAGAIDRPGDFPALVNDPWFVADIVAYVAKEVPFVAVVALAMLAAVGSAPAITARCLGATPLQAFRHVTWPLIRPGILAAATVVFAFVLGTYEVPAVLGPSHPKALPVLAYQMFTSNDIADRPAAIVVSLLMAAVGVVCLVAVRRLMRGISGLEVVR
ncbi:ABC transporter permease [Chthonobacter rhizosphaerae]|uniref:ABC transporter permease n=1 Tax=Chthonobacter rhizosphaerae TaxID=2735553 RepID=UPI0015EEFAB3|nr:ABC transporter permease subunit [Chthonobacter rhizosphaerae]